MLAWRVSGLRLLLASTAAALAGPAAAAAEQRYDIPAQDLGGALQQFGIQSGEPVIFRAEIVGETRSPSVSGVFSAEAALAALLKGSRLSFLRAEHGFVILPQGRSPPRQAPGRGAAIDAGARIEPAGAGP